MSQQVSLRKGDKKNLATLTGSVAFFLPFSSLNGSELANWKLPCAATAFENFAVIFSVRTILNWQHRRSLLLLKVYKSLKLKGLFTCTQQAFRQSLNSDQLSIRTDNESFSQQHEWVTALGILINWDETHWVSENIYLLARRTEGVTSISLVAW